LSIFSEFENGSVIIKTCLHLFLHLLGTHGLALHFSLVLFSDFISVFATSFLAFISPNSFCKILRLVFHLLFYFFAIFFFEVDFEAFGISIHILLQFLIRRRALRILNIATLCQVTLWNAKDFFAIAIISGLTGLQKFLLGLPIELPHIAHIRLQVSKRCRIIISFHNFVLAHLLNFMNVDTLGHGAEKESG